MSETIFEKERKPSSKPLTKKQKEALAKGRARLREKRAGVGDDVPDQAVKTRQKEERLARQRVLDEKREIDIYNKLMKKGNDKIAKFVDLKYKWLDKASSVKEYKDMKAVLDTITEEDILEDSHIPKLVEGARSFSKAKKSVSFEKEPLDDVSYVDK